VTKRCAEHVRTIGERRNAYRTSVGKLKRKDHLGDLSEDNNIILKWTWIDQNTHVHKQITQGSWLQRFMCVWAQVSCSVICNWSLCDLFVDVCILIYLGFHLLSIIFNFFFNFVCSWDTRRWIKSKNTIRLIQWWALVNMVWTFRSHTRRSISWLPL
jgi:hypothetical protein